MEEKKPLVVVLSRTYSTGLNVVRALGKAGYTVVLVASTHRSGTFEIVANSKYVRDSVEVVSKKAEDGLDRELIDEVMKYADQEETEKILFPTDDYTVSVVDMYQDVLSNYFKLPHIVDRNGAGSLTAYMDKVLQRELAEKAGFDMPKEWIVELSDIVVPDHLTYPCFCKPYDAATGLKKEIKICEDEETLKGYLQRLRRKESQRKFVVQEYLNIDQELLISGVCFDQNVFLPGIVKGTNFAQYKKSVILGGEVVSFDQFEGLKQRICDFLKEFHYVGMFELELNVVGDKIYFNELNLRSGLSSFAYLHSGINLPAKFVDYVCGNNAALDDLTTVEFGKKFIFENVAWNDYRKGFMTKSELLECIDSVDFGFIADEDDPEPEKVFKGSLNKEPKPKRRMSLKRRIKKWIKRHILPLLRPLKYAILRYPQMDKKNQRDANMEKPRVVVSGRNYGSNLCIARALGMAGYEVEIMRVFHRKPKLRQVIKMLKPDAYSKYVKAYHTCVYGGKSWRVANRLKKIADPDRKMLLIPADDLVACIADDYLEELSPYYVVSNVKNKAGEINRLMSKGVQKELALAAGLPVVNSCVIKTINGEFEIPESVTYPCFIKPNISKNGSKTKMRRCDSEAELKGAMEELCEKKDVEMLVEDFVEIAREYSILGVSTKNGAIGPGFFVAEEGGQKEHRGIAITGKILPCDQRKQLIDDIVNFIGGLEFDGLYDVDLLETVDGKMYFIELNMRFGGSGYGVTESGVNLPGMYADYMLLGKPIDMDCKLEEPGKRFVSEKILIEEYINNRMTMARVNEIIDDVDIHFIKNAQDPKPYKHFRRFYPVATLMRTIYRIRDNFNSEFEK